MFQWGRERKRQRQIGSDTDTGKKSFEGVIDRMNEER